MRLEAYRAVTDPLDAFEQAQIAYDEWLAALLHGTQTQLTECAMRHRQWASRFAKLAKHKA